MSKVARIELWNVAVPLPATFRPSWIPGFPQNENRFDLVRVFTDDGVEGVAAGPAMGRERQGLGSILGPYILGEDATDIAVVQQRLRELGYLGWRNFWIEPAFWDIKGKLAGRPLCELLTGKPAPKSVRLYASSGEVRDPRRRADEVLARIDEGFTAFKMRVHEDEAADVRQVTETARAIGGKARLAVDANQAWRVAAIADAPAWDLARAKRFADACADAGIAWIEEPLAMDAWDDQAALAAYSKVPIAGGETHHGGLPELRMMIERRCYHVFQPDAVFTGGVAQTWEVAKLCKQHGLRYTPHTWTNGFGFAVNLQLKAASIAEDPEHEALPLEYPLDPPGWVPEARDGVLTEPFVHRRGGLDLPRGPGLGVTIDEKALRRFGHRTFVMDKKRLVWFAVRDRGLRAALEIDRARKARRAKT